MPSPGFGRTEVEILLFCFNGKWTNEERTSTYAPDLKSEVEIDRFVRNEKLIKTDVKIQLNKHLTHLVKEGWLQYENDKYWYSKIDLLGLSLLLLFVATYKANGLEELLSKPLFKESWNLFKDSLFYDIYPFTEKYDLEGTEKSIRTEIAEAPIGSESIDILLNSKDRRRTIQETIKKLQHESGDFRYYLLANPFENRALCDVLADLSLKHQLESVEKSMESPRFIDRRVRSKLSRFGWTIGLKKLGVNLNEDLSLWKIRSLPYDEWSNPLLAALESKFFSSKKFAIYLSTLVASGSMYRYLLKNNEANISLPVSFRAIATELMLTHPIDLIPLLGSYLNEKKPEELDTINRLGRILVRPDPSKNTWQPVFALPYRYNSTLPAGHPGSHPLIALAILIHGSIENDETISAISGIIGEKAKDLIEQNSFPAAELPKKALSYYFSLRDFVLKDALPLIEYEMKDRVFRFKELKDNIEHAKRNKDFKELEELLKGLDREITRTKITHHMEGMDTFKEDDK